MDEEWGVPAGFDVLGSVSLLNDTEHSLWTCKGCGAVVTENTAGLHEKRCHALRNRFMGAYPDEKES